MIQSHSQGTMQRTGQTSIAVRIRLARAIMHRLGSGNTKDRELVLSVSGLPFRDAADQAQVQVALAATIGSKPVDPAESLGLPNSADCSMERDHERGLVHMAIDGVGELTADNAGTVVYAKLPALERLGGGRYRLI